MNVSTKIMAIRQERASELIRFARLLEKMNLGQMYQIYDAANCLQDKSKGIHSPGTTDYNCWGYTIDNLTFNLPVLSQRHIHPSTIHSIQVSIDIDLLCRHDIWETLNDPLIRLNFRARIVGIDFKQKYSFGFHIDRHDEDLNTDELHPIYHLQYTPSVDENMDVGRVLLLDAPRMMHVPVDLILGTDLILSNFSPRIWDKLRDESEYQALYKRYQNNFWKPYIHTWASHWSYKNSDISWVSPKSICPYLID